MSHKNLLDTITNKEWRQFIGNSPYIEQIEKKLEMEMNILPKRNLIFNAFNKTPLSNLKIVMLGQDPYPKSKDAFGCSFIVDKMPESLYPASLDNMIKELRRCYPEFEKSKITDLTKWCEEGVLLLNSILTVREGEPKSHDKIGWQEFTKQIIKKLDETKSNIIFLCLGSVSAQIVRGVVKNNIIVVEGHPSPLNSGSNQFFKSNCYKKCNDILVKNNILPVRWWSIFDGGKTNEISESESDSGDYL